MRSVVSFMLVWCFLSAPASAMALDVADVPNPRAHKGWVSDQAGILGSARVALEQRLQKLHDDTGAQVAVVTLDSIDDDSPREFANELFAAWGIGRKDVDDGVLVLHVLDQRRIEIRTGYGVEGRLPDAKCKWLIDDVVLPQFRAYEFARGHLALAFGVDKALREPEVTHDVLVAATNAYAATLPSAPSSWRKFKRIFEPEYRNDVSWVYVPLTLLFGVWMAIVVGWSLRRYHGPGFVLADKLWALRVALPFVISMVALIAIFGATTRGYQTSFCVAYGIWIFLMLIVSGRMAWRAHQRARRKCNHCKRVMERLSGDEQLAALSEGQRVELRLHAVYHDAYACVCGAHEVVDLPGAVKLDKCDVCGFQTVGKPKAVLLRSATDMKNGLQALHYTCENCGDFRSVADVIYADGPIGRSDSGSSSSGSSSSASSSSGDNFGGGSSGGGGAGGSY